MAKYSLTLFMPKNGRMQIPTSLITVVPFDRCPACEAERAEVNMRSVTFACGMTQMRTDCEEFAISSYCPYAMAAIYDMRTKRLRRGVSDTTPATLVTFAVEKFKIGEEVKWVSQSAGTETVKKGMIVAVVPPEARPEDYIPDGMRKNSAKGYGRSRPHTTYLIKVKSKGSMVYWPRVPCLERI